MNMMGEDDETEALEKQRRIQRFKWFVVAVTLFCLLMIFWLPR